MDTINVLYDTNNCLARLKGDMKKQCTHKPRPNSLFCGTHLKCTIIHRIDEPEPLNITKSVKPKKKLLNLNDLFKLYRKFLTDQSSINNCSNLYYTNQHYKFNVSNIESPSSIILKLIDFITRLENYKKNIKSIVKCQAIIRGFITRRVNLWRGPALLKRHLSNNDTDFLTYEPINTIPINDFFSYKDTDGFIYSFTIKSLNYIAETTKQNPYNRKDLPESSIENIKKILRLKKPDIKIDFNLPQDKESLIKQKCVKIFQRMDDLKLYTQPRWFLDLDINKLKKLYSETEDIWNYRAMLTPDQKKKYTKNGTAFLQSVAKMNKLQDKYILQNVILNEYEKFAYEGTTDDDCTTSCYWILMGLSIVSENAAEGMPELVHSQVIN
jgi:hypothetical protein